MAIGEMEEEGDDTCTLAFDLVAFPDHGFCLSIESAAVPVMISVERASPPLVQQLYLRC